MSIAVAVKYMLEAGVAADAIVAAVAEMEAAITPVRSKAAERQARYRQRNKASQNVTGDGKRNEIPLSPSPLSSPHTPQQTPHPHTPEYKTPARVKADPFPKPNWADPAVWADFLKNRKAKRKPNTASAHARLLSDVQREVERSGKPPGEVLRLCTEQGWAAIYEISENDDGNKSAGKYRASGHGSDRRGQISPDGFGAAVRAVAGRGASPSLALDG